MLRIYDVGGDERAERRPAVHRDGADQGRTLLQEIEQRGPVLAEIAACIGALLADALAAAHKAGIIHRDIKPANVLIAQGGRLLLADFGVARLETEDSLVTKTGALLGTPAYMSPEQASGDTATAKSDLYSLGATLYQLATGLAAVHGLAGEGAWRQIATGALVSAVRRRAGGRAGSVARDRSADGDRARRAAGEREGGRGGAARARGGRRARRADRRARGVLRGSRRVLASRTPTVVTALVTAAQRAIDDGKLPRAMALADRASALAPEDPAVNALVEEVTEAGRSRRGGGDSSRSARASARGARRVARSLARRGSVSTARQPDAARERRSSSRDRRPAIATEARQPSASCGCRASMRRSHAMRALGRSARVAMRARRCVSVARTARGDRRDAAAIRRGGAARPDAADAMATMIVENDAWCTYHDRRQGLRRRGGPLEDLRHRRPPRDPLRAVRKPQVGRDGRLAPNETRTLHHQMRGVVPVTIAVEAPRRSAAPPTSAARSSSSSRRHECDRGRRPREVHRHPGAPAPSSDQPDFDCYPYDP